MFQIILQCLIYVLLKGTTIGAAIGLSLILWTAIGFYADNPYVAYPDTEVSGCSENITLPTIPTEDK